MDILLQMPLPRYCKTAICPFARSVVGIRRLESPVRYSHVFAFSALPTEQSVTRRFLSFARLSRSDDTTLNQGLHRCLEIYAGQSKCRLLSGPKRYGPLEPGSLKKLSFCRASALESPAKRTKSSKRAVQLTVAQVTTEQSLVKVWNLVYKSHSGVSGIVTDPHTFFPHGCAFVNTATMENLDPEGNTHRGRENKVSVMESSNNQNGSRPSKRAKKDSDEAVTIKKLNMCSKYGDLHGALEIYDKIKREGVLKLQQHYYNILLYICSGAASGNLTSARGGRDKHTSEIATLDSSKQGIKEIENPEVLTETRPELSSDGTHSDSKSLTGANRGASDRDVVHFSPQEMELALTRGLEICDDMLQADVPFNEATFTSMARLAFAKDDGDLAFEIVKRMAAANIAPKLRSYGPALLSFCKKQEIQKAFEVDEHMCSAGVLPDEGLLGALLEACIEAGLDNKIYYLLQRLRTTVRELSPTNVGIIERWFTSEAAVSAGKAVWENLPSQEALKAATEATGGGWHGLGWLGKGNWKVRRTNINNSGTCLSCGEKLCIIDLDLQETDSFANSVTGLACQREQKPKDFRAFQRWVDNHGPFEAVLDGANIGLYNSQFSHAFNFKQLDAVVNAVRARSPTNALPLIILHYRRTRDISALSEKAQSTISSWIQANALYSTPAGSNDDWYWLYAAVKWKCLLVSNDEMRDHLFELLGNDFFPKWKERHQVRFTFMSNVLELHMPPPYSTVIQESVTGSWHIPQVRGDEINAPQEWLCVTRPDPVKSES